MGWLYIEDYEWIYRYDYYNIDEKIGVYIMWKDDKNEISSINFSIKNLQLGYSKCAAYIPFFLVQNTFYEVLQ